MFSTLLVFLAVAGGALAALIVPTWVALWVFGVSIFVLVANHLYWIRQLRQRPVLAAVLSQANYLLVFISSSAATYFGVAFAGAFPSWLPTVAPTADADTVDSVAKILTGAVSTMIGVLWLDNAKSPEGSYWPDGAFRRALSQSFSGADIFDVPLGQQRSTQLNRLYSLVYDSIVLGGDISGWDYQARVARARGVRDLDPVRN